PALVQHLANSTWVFQLDIQHAHAPRAKIATYACKFLQRRAQEADAVDRNPLVHAVRLPSLSALLDLQAEAFAERRELGVKLLDVLADHVGGIHKLAVAITLVVLEIGAHRRFGRGRERHVALLIEAADHANRISDEVRVAYVMDALVVQER